MWTHGGWNSQRGHWWPSSRREITIRTFWMLIDAACWALALSMLMWFRLHDAGLSSAATSTWILASSAAVTHMIIGLTVGPYRVSHLRGSFEEVVAVAGTAAGTAAVLTVSALLVPDLLLPRSVAVFGTALAIVLMFALRFFVRAVRSRRRARRPRADKVIVLGAGLAGRRLVHNLLTDEASDLVPVALLDDDRGKRRLRVAGVPVRGTSQDILAVSALTGAKHLVVAVPQPSPELMRQVHETCRGLIDVKVLPALHPRLQPASPQVNDVREGAGEEHHDDRPGAGPGRDGSLGLPRRG